MTDRYGAREAAKTILAESTRELSSFEVAAISRNDGRWGNGWSENTMASRLSDLQGNGIARGDYRPETGKKYKFWRLAKDGEIVKTFKPRPISIPVVGVKDTLCPGMQILTVSVPSALAGKRIAYRVEARTA